jgi:hypothetical protein
MTSSPPRRIVLPVLCDGNPVVPGKVDFGAKVQGFECAAIERLGKAERWKSEK